ncbi:MAG: sulfotransferase [Mangrovicoccus sp.]
MKRLLFCLGVIKAGTTWLHWALNGHPQIGRIPRKELHYFLRQYGGIDRLTDHGRWNQFKVHLDRSSIVAPYDKKKRNERTDPELYGSPWDHTQMAEWWGPKGDARRRLANIPNDQDWYYKFLEAPINDAWYRNLFSEIGPDQWATDFSTTSYMIRPEGFKDMANFAEDSRAILILRNPLDRLWSHVKFHAEVINIEEEKLHYWSAQKYRKFTEEFALQDYSFYADAVEAMITHFPPEKRLILNFEDIRRDGEAVFQRVQKFLDLEPISLKDRLQDQKIASSLQIPLQRGIFSHLCPQFEKDLDRLLDLGVDFAEPWRDHVRRHGKEWPKPDFFGARTLARRASNYVHDAKIRAAQTKETSEK